MKYEQVSGERTVLGLLQDRIDGLTAWHTAARSRELADRARKDSRELRLDARRRLEALHRVNDALITRSEAATAEAERRLDVSTPRAVVIHRQAWMREKLAAGLVQEGLLVVAVVEDGADGLGICIAEQPDVVVLEDRLPSMTSLDVLRALRQFAPRTVVTAQVESDASTRPLIDAGATAVFSRRVPPALLCQEVADHLRKRPEHNVAAT
ncbi:MAG: transcriptional regulator [Frankiales bacterium]|nr:transcriptional regulator [Frankiales bacterium]